MGIQVISSPIGPLTLISDGRFLCRVDFGAHPHTSGDTADAVTREAELQINAYFAGTLNQFTLPLAPSGTPFQRRVWALLEAIPFGETRTYGELAVAAGSPRGARAVGMACNKNPLPLVIPCHRVVGAQGSLTGFAGGLDAKARLLRLEGARE